MSKKMHHAHKSVDLMRFVFSKSFVLSFLLSNIILIAPLMLWMMIASSTVPQDTTWGSIGRFPLSGLAYIGKIVAMASFFITTIVNIPPLIFVWWQNDLAYKNYRHILALWLVVLIAVILLASILTGFFPVMVLWAIVIMAIIMAGVSSNAYGIVLLRQASKTYIYQSAVMFIIWNFVCLLFAGSLMVILEVVK